MPRRSSQDNILMRPLPSPRIPWMVILVLISGIVLIYMGFLRPKQKLLGPPVREPEYVQYMAKPKRPVVKPSPTTPTAPASTQASTPAKAPATPPPAREAGQ